MKRTHTFWKSLLLITIMSFATAAVAQKYGGTLRIPARENPVSASPHEEGSITTLQPFMPVFNNLVIFDQQEKVVRPESIRPELATEWSWSPDNTVLTMKLRQGVRWHDGKPFTSADVQCTWDTLTGKRDAQWRKNTHKEWYHNLKEVTVAGPYEVRFTLGRPQPSFLSFLASGWSPVYPCHVDGRVMRQKPIGTGPFKVEEFKVSDVIRLVKNTDYWKPGRPYLDGIEWRIVPSAATRTLSFIAGKFDMLATADVTVGALKDIRSQAPKATCETRASNSTGFLLINQKAAPFDNPKLRRAMSLALDRSEFVRAQQGEGRIGGIMMAPPAGVWGLTPAQLATVPGMGKDVEKNRAEGRKIMRELGYGPNNKLKTTFIVRLATPDYLMATSLIADQLRSIYIESEIEQKETAVWTGAMIKGTYALGYQGTAAAIDDPDVVFYEGYNCKSARNYTHYCNPAMEAKIDEQSATVDPVKRKQLVQAIDLMLLKDVARAAMYQADVRACRYSYVKGVVVPTNSSYTHHRMEDVWLDK